MILEWTESLAVGHDLIDSHHREIFRRYRTFLEKCDREHSIDQLRALFAYLQTYVDEHFAAEEELMSGHQYPGLADHRKDHDYFRQRLTELMAEFESSGPNIEILVVTNKTLVRWLADHIQKTDMRLAAFLRNENEIVG